MIDGDEAIAQAVALAKQVDAVLVVGGLTPEWESEGFDRPSLAMPGRQDELIAALAAANPNVVVAIQAVRLTILHDLFERCLPRVRGQRYRCLG